MALKDAVADFSQGNFDIKAAIDGNTKGQNNVGWAASPSLGVPHWATFQTQAPVGHQGGTVLTITLHHNFSGPEFSLGRFRLSVAAAPKPTGLSLVR